MRVVLVPDGGHCAFVEDPSPGYDGYWAEREIVRFASAVDAERTNVRLYPYREPASTRT
jgi:hypothetical protein